MLSKFIFDQTGPEQHPKDPVIGCSIWENALCIDCRKSGRCRYEDAARQEVA
jgi:hypothetical protein